MKMWRLTVLHQLQKIKARGQTAMRRASPTSPSKSTPTTWQQTTKCGWNTTQSSKTIIGFEAEGKDKDEVEEYNDGLDSLIDGEISDIVFENQCDEEVGLQAKALGHADEAPCETSGADIDSAAPEKRLGCKVEDVAGQNDEGEEGKAEDVDAADVEVAKVDVADVEATDQEANIHQASNVEAETDETKHDITADGEGADREAAYFKAIDVKTAADDGAPSAETEPAQAEHSEAASDDTDVVEMDYDATSDHEAGHVDAEHGKAEHSKAKQQESRNGDTAVASVPDEAGATDRAAVEISSKPMNKIYEEVTNTSDHTDADDVSVEQEMASEVSTTIEHPNTVAKDNLAHIYFNHESPVATNNASTPSCCPV